MSAVCVIPARGRSTRIPRKNIKKFHGKPIIAHSIDIARESGLFKEVVVSTEDIEIANIALHYGANIELRDKNLSDNDTGTQEVARSVLINDRYDHYIHACVIYATSPLLSIEDLRRGYRMLKTSRSVKYAYSTDLKGVDAGNFYWGRRVDFVNSVPLAGNSIHVPIQPDRVCDINTIEDWREAELKYTNLRR